VDQRQIRRLHEHEANRVVVDVDVEHRVRHGRVEDVESVHKLDGFFKVDHVLVRVRVLFAIPLERVDEKHERILDAVVVQVIDVLDGHVGLD
jgi:hypothetical protein